MKPGPSNRSRGRLRVAAVQMKFARTIAGNLAKIESAIGAAARRRADVVLFPECAVTGYSFDFGKLQSAEIREALATVGSLAQQRSINVLVGSPVRRGSRL